jgi:hypothetical protein
MQKGKIQKATNYTGITCVRVFLLLKHLSKDESKKNTIHKIAIQQANHLEQQGE